MFNRSYAAVQLLAPTTMSTSANGSAVDLATYASVANRELKVAFQAAGVAGTSPSITLAVTECDTTNGTYAAPAAGTSSAVITTNGLTELNVYVSKRYVRSEIAFTSNTTNGAISCVAFVLKRDGG